MHKSKYEQRVLGYLWYHWCCNDNKFFSVARQSTKWILCVSPCLSCQKHSTSCSHRITKPFALASLLGCASLKTALSQILKPYSCSSGLCWAPHLGTAAARNALKVSKKLIVNILALQHFNFMRYFHTLVSYNGEENSQHTLVAPHICIAKGARTESSVEE